MDDSLVAWTGFIQGIGMGLAYVPLATVAFATLAARFRNEGTAVFNLLRNIGSSVGIAAFQAIFIRNTQIMHARLAEHVTPFGAHGQGIAELGNTAALAALNGRVTQQATMIAYNNDFKLMFVLSVLTIPFAFIFRKPRPHSSPAAVAAE
jgi:DHA2 family multidrug resistance protein